MTELSAQERHQIALRLAEIKAEAATIGHQPSPTEEQILAELDAERTELVRKLNACDSA